VGEIDRGFLRSLASKYIWWQLPDEAVAMPKRVIARVMNIGDYADVEPLASQVGNEVLRDVLIHAEIGQFSAHSWAYWHYRLGLARVGNLPPMPMRRLA
jgi:hypothetical protein